MSKVTLSLGLLLLIAFALSGQHMTHVVVPRFHDDLLQRMMARANHIYLLFAGLLNVSAGLIDAPPGWRGRAVNAGRVLLWVAGLAFAWGYLKEYAGSFADRKWALPGCLLSAAGTLLLMAKLGSAKRNSF